MNLFKVFSYSGFECSYFAALVSHRNIHRIFIPSIYVSEETAHRLIVDSLLQTKRCANVNCDVPPKTREWKYWLIPLHKSEKWWLSALDPGLNSEGNRLHFAALKMRKAGNILPCLCLHVLWVPNPKIYNQSGCRTDQLQNRSSHHHSNSRVLLFDVLFNTFQWLLVVDRTTSCRGYQVGTGTGRFRRFRSRWDFRAEKVPSLLTCKGHPDRPEQPWSKPHFCGWDLRLLVDLLQAWKRPSKWLFRMVTKGLDQNTRFNLGDNKGKSFYLTCLLQVSCKKKKN